MKIESGHLNFCLLYWGRKGGGKRLFQETVRELAADTTRRFHISARAEVIEELEIDFTRISFIRGAFSSRQRNFALEMILFLKEFRTFKKEFKRRKVTNIVIVMSSPFDILLRNRKGSHIRIWRVLHDAKPHQGDFWPNKFFIKYFLKTSNIITLSHHVSNQIGNRQSLKTELNRNIEPKTKAVAVSTDYLLIAGRMKTYKNLQEITKVFSVFPEQKFLLAGDLGLKKVTGLPNLKVIDRWLEDSELEYIISRARGLIAVYSDASQSGIVEQALYWGVPILYSNRGGVVEQIRDGIDGVGLAEIDANSIATGVKALLKMKRRDKQQEIKPNLAQCLVESGEFSPCEKSPELP